MNAGGLPIATQPRQFFSAEKGSTLSERSEFVIPPVKIIAEGSRRPSCRAGFFCYFSCPPRKVERNKAVTRIESESSSNKFVLDPFCSFGTRATSCPCHPRCTSFFIVSDYQVPPHSSELRRLANCICVSENILFQILQT